MFTYLVSEDGFDTKHGRTAVAQQLSGSQKTKLWGIFVLYHHHAAVTETGVCSQAQPSNMISLTRLANTHHTFFSITCWQEGDQLLMQLTGDNGCSPTSTCAMPRGQREGEDTSPNTISSF